MKKELLFQTIIEVPFHGILKNNKQIFINKKTGKRFLTSSDKCKLAQSIIINKLTADKYSKKLNTINEPVVAEFCFSYPKEIYYTKKGVKSNKVADMSNLYQLPEDCLQRSGILENDSLIENHGNSLRVPSINDKYYLIIRIFSIVQAALSFEYEKIHS